MLKTLDFAELTLHPPFFPCPNGRISSLKLHSSMVQWRIYISGFFCFVLQGYFFVSVVFFRLDFFVVFLFVFLFVFVCLFVCSLPLFFSFRYRDKLQWREQHQEITVDIFYIVRITQSFLERGRKIFISKIPPLLTCIPLDEFCLLSVILGNWYSHEWHFSSKQSHMEKTHLLA